MSDILNFAFCEIARVSHLRHSKPRDLPLSSLGLTRKRHIAKCREMAAEAERIASYVSAEARSGYIELASQLRTRADEMETALSSRECRVRPQHGNFSR